MSSLSSLLVRQKRLCRSRPRGTYRQVHLLHNRSQPFHNFDRFAMLQPLKHRQLTDRWSLLLLFILISSFTAKSLRRNACCVLSSGGVQTRLVKVVLFRSLSLFVQYFAPNATVQSCPNLSTTLFPMRSQHKKRSTIELPAKQQSQ